MSGLAKPQGIRPERRERRASANPEERGALSAGRNGAKPQGIRPERRERRASAN